MEEHREQVAGVDYDGVRTAVVDVPRPRIGTVVSQRGTAS